LSKRDLNSLYLEYAKNPTCDDPFWTAAMNYIAALTTDEDLRQTTIMHVYEAIYSGAYTHEGHIEHWIAKIQRNGKTDEQRRPKPDQLVIEMPSSSVPVSVKRTSSRIRQPDSVSLKLSVIEDPLDRMLAESILEGLTLKETAERCYVDVATVKRRLKRLGEKLGHPCALLH
jgi:DNA-directed RNA polymerase specialized sigma24 family protein